MTDFFDDWPPELQVLVPLMRGLHKSTLSCIDRWTFPTCWVLQENAWVPESDAQVIEVDDRPREWRGPHLVWGWCPILGANTERARLVDSRGIQRTPELWGARYELVKAGLVAEVLGDGAPPDLRALVSLAFALGHLSWVEARTGPSRA